MVDFKSVAYMAFNFFASVIIINVNNAVFKVYHYNFSTFLTGVHFVVTFLGLLICAQFGMFKIKTDVRPRDVLELSLSFIGFVVFNNLSLQYNSMGFYQLMKVLTTPAIVVIQYFAYGVQVHNKLKLALVPVCIGVAMASVSDVEVNSKGTVFAVLGIISTSFYQIWVKTKQQDMKLDSYQLLFLQAPVSAVIVFAVSLLVDPVQPGGWLDYEYSVESMSAIFASCLLALLVNLSIFLVIGKTSPVAYNVLGHFKLCVILMSGFIVFHEDANTTKVAGTVIAFSGVVLYTHYQQNLKSGWEKREEVGKQVAPGPTSTSDAAPENKATQSAPLISSEDPRSGLDSVGIEMPETRK